MLPISNLVLAHKYFVSRIWYVKQLPCCWSRQKNEISKVFGRLCSAALFTPFVTKLASQIIT